MNQTTISIVSGVLCPGFYDRVFKIFTIFLLVFALSANGVTAQEQRPRNGIAVGEVVPDDIWRGVNQSYEGGTSDGSEPLGIMPLTLSQYKGKLILLDFWATYCVPCISNFTKMKLLQEKYRNDLQIILVNNEPV